MSHWIDVRMARLPGIACAENPGESVGTRNPRTPSSVCAHTTATSATVASPIHRFRPSITQSEPSRRATVVIAAGSLPPAGSVRAKHPTARPAASSGSHRCFCCSEPNVAIAVIARDPCTETNVRQPLSTASISRHAAP